MGQLSVSVQRADSGYSLSIRLQKHFCVLNLAGSDHFLMDFIFCGVGKKQ